MDSRTPVCDDCCVTGIAMDSHNDEAEEAVDGFEPLSDEQDEPEEAPAHAPSKPSYAFVAVLTTLLLAYTNKSLTGLP